MSSYPCVRAQADTSPQRATGRVPAAPLRPRGMLTCQQQYLPVDQRRLQAIIRGGSRRSSEAAPGNHQRRLQAIIRGGSRRSSGRLQAIVRGGSRRSLEEVPGNHQRRLQTTGSEGQTATQSRSMDTHGARLPPPPPPRPAHCL